MASFRAADLIQAALRLGLVLDRKKGSHAVYVRGNERVVIPVHGARTIKPKTLAGILSDLGINIDELRKLL